MSRPVLTACPKGIGRKGRRGGGTIRVPRSASSEAERAAFRRSKAGQITRFAPLSHAACQRNHALHGFFDRPQDRPGDVPAGP